MSCQKDCMLIGIAGGTGSGKSTFTNRIKKQFGDDVTVIYHDNYYRRRDDIPFEERKKINYDHPDALETDMLIEHIKQLKAGKSVVCPVYDFSVHNRRRRSVSVFRFSRAGMVFLGQSGRSARRQTVIPSIRISARRLKASRHPTAPWETGAPPALPPTAAVPPPGQHS